MPTTADNLAALTASIAADAKALSDAQALRIAAETKASQAASDLAAVRADRDAQLAIVSTLNAKIAALQGTTAGGTGVGTGSQQSEATGPTAPITPKITVVEQTITGSGMTLAGDLGGKIYSGSFFVSSDTRNGRFKTPNGQPGVDLFKGSLFDFAFLDGCGEGVYFDGDDTLAERGTFGTIFGYPLYFRGHKRCGARDIRIDPGSGGQSCSRSEGASGFMHRVLVNYHTPSEKAIFRGHTDPTPWTYNGKTYTGFVHDSCDYQGAVGGQNPLNSMEGGDGMFIEQAYCNAGLVDVSNPDVCRKAVLAAQAAGKRGVDLVRAFRTVAQVNGKPMVMDDKYLQQNVDQRQAKLKDAGVGNIINSHLNHVPLTCETGGRHYIDSASLIEGDSLFGAASLAYPRSVNALIGDFKKPDPYFQFDRTKVNLTKPIPSELLKFCHGTMILNGKEIGLAPVAA